MSEQVQKLIQSCRECGNERTCQMREIKLAHPENFKGPCRFQTKKKRV